MPVNIESQPFFKISHWFMLVASFCLFVIAINKPIQTWDILGYAGAVKSLEVSNKEEIHQSVFSELRAYATEEELSDLLDSSDYRRTMHQDADAFNQQIPFYKIRILFITLILILTKLGINAFIGSHIIVAATGAGGLLAFYYAFRKLIFPAFWLIVPMFFIVLSGLEISRMSTADPLAFLWVGLICYAFIHQKWPLFFALIVSSVLVRTDLLVLVGIFTVYLMLFKPTLRIVSGLALLVSMGVYLLVTHYTGNYGWSTVFYYALISDMQATHPVEYSSIGVSMSQYFSEVVFNIGGFIDEPPLLLFLALVIFQFILFFSAQEKSNQKKNMVAKVADCMPIALTTIGVLYVFAHYFMFPLLENRFFVAEYMIALLSLLALVTRLMLKESSKNLKS